MEQDKKELFDNILDAMRTKSGNRPRPPTSTGTHMRKNRSGVFSKHYGTKWFCTSTGAVYTLQERDPETGLNVLRVNRHVAGRILKFDRKFLHLGVIPHSVGDIYLTDAETILLLREYPLPHLGIELKFITKENIENAIKRIDEANDALRDEIYIRNYHRKFIYRLGWLKETTQTKAAIKVKGHPKFTNVVKAIHGMHQDKKKLDEVLGIEEQTSVRVPTGRPRGRPRRELSTRKSDNSYKKKKKPTPDPS